MSELKQTRQNRRPAWSTLLLVFSAIVFAISAVVLFYVLCRPARQADPAAEAPAPDPVPVRVQMGRLEWFDGAAWVDYEDMEELMRQDPFQSVEPVLLEDENTLPAERQEGRTRSAQSGGGSSGGSGGSSGGGSSGGGGGSSGGGDSAGGGSDGQDISAGDL